jgi:hypothetical protein
VTTGLASSVAAGALDALYNSVAYDGPTNLWAKLHTGDPGAAGTANAATNTTRKEVTFAAASGNAIASDAAVTWTSVPASEDYTHFSLWTDETAGSFHTSGTITANAVTIGDNFTIPSGDVDITISAAA